MEQFEQIFKCREHETYVHYGVIIYSQYFNNCMVPLDYIFLCLYLSILLRKATPVPSFREIDKDERNALTSELQVRYVHLVT